MGELWMPQEMQMLQLYIQREAAHATVDELGKLGLIQFRDLNASVNAFQRNFVNEIRRCDEAERKLRYFHDQLIKEQISNRTLLEDVKVAEADGELAQRPMSFDELEPFLEQSERDLRLINSNTEQITRNYNELMELKNVLKLDATFFDQSSAAKEVSSSRPHDEARVSLLAEENGPHYTRIEFLAGVVLRSRATAFERVLWRALHGNLYMRSSEIDDTICDPVSGEKMKMNVFIVFYHGQQSLAKTRKVGEAFGARLFECPEDRVQRAALLEQVTTRAEDMHVVLERASEHRRQLLVTLAESLNAWAVFVRKEKCIYTTLNCFNYDPTKACLIAEGWCPVKRTADVQAAINRAAKRAAVDAPSLITFLKSTEEPPTYFPTNKYTASFQGIVEAYGVARYREVNAGVFTIVTFPFLFSIMFGDWGHALLILGGALAFIHWEKQLARVRLDEIIGMLFDGRYLLLAMAGFSLYTGILYNECFSLPWSFFGTRFTAPDGSPCKGQCVRTGPTYPFGVDPLWRGADNELYYYNSLKMKVSIVVGVCQMILGTNLSYFNYREWKKPLDLFFGYIPQLLFLLCIFGYLVALIIFKWLVPPEDLLHVPYLINVVIDMFLQFPSPPEEEMMYPGQRFFQNCLVVVALLSVLAMLIPKPIILMIQDRRLKARRAAGEVVEVEKDFHDEMASDDGEFHLVDTYILQSIFTIEFCLGCISHTASYLRLWALSLAHSELSDVFYNQIFMNTIKTGNFFMITIGFCVWGGVTIGILLFMEALSAFLHALRLHWVEFQSKFYHGDGYAFTPFNYPTIVGKVKDEYCLDAPEVN